jgi:hypothetical protein
MKVQRHWLQVTVPCRISPLIVLSSSNMYLTDIARLNETKFDENFAPWGDLYIVTFFSWEIDRMTRLFSMINLAHNGEVWLVRMDELQWRTPVHPSAYNTTVRSRHDAYYCVLTFFLWRNIKRWWFSCCCFYRNSDVCNYVSSLFVQSPSLGLETRWRKEIDCEKKKSDRVHVACHSQPKHRT